MDLAQLSAQITANPLLQSIPFNNLLLFLAAATTIKNDLALMQPSDHPLATPPDVLPRPAQYFLSDACGLSINTVLQCWSAFKDTAWCSDQPRVLLHALLSTFHEHGIPHGFSMYMAVHRCMCTYSFFWQPHGHSIRLLNIAQPLPVLGHSRECV